MKKIIRIFHNKGADIASEDTVGADTASADPASEDTVGADTRAQTQRPHIMCLHHEERCAEGSVGVRMCGCAGGISKKERSQPANQFLTFKPG